MGLFCDLGGFNTPDRLIVLQVPVMHYFIRLYLFCKDDALGRLGKEIEGCLAIFCMATYGEGDPTDNAQELYDWLKETSESLDGLRYAVRIN